MNKHDRQKMRDRFIKDLAGRFFSRELTIDDLADFTAREVDRAVRAERKAQRDTEDLRLSALRRADARMIERAKAMTLRSPAAILMDEERAKSSGRKS